MLSAKLPVHIYHSFRGCKISTSHGQDISKLRGLPSCARTGSPAAATAYLGTTRVRTGGFSQQQEHSWANASSGATGTPGWQCCKSPCLVTQWKPWPVRSQTPGEVWLWPPWCLCDLSPLLLQSGIFPSPFTHFWLLQLLQLRNGFKWRLISLVGAWHLHGLMWAAGWDGEERRQTVTNWHLASPTARQLWPETDPGTGMWRSQREMAVLAGLE